MTHHHATSTRAEWTIPIENFLWLALVHVLDVEKKFCLGRLTHCRVMNWTFQCTPCHPLEECASVLVQESVTRLQHGGSLELVALPESRAFGAGADCLSVTEPARLIARSTSPARFWSILNNVQCSFENRVFRDGSLQPFHDTLWGAPTLWYVHSRQSARHYEHDAEYPNRWSMACGRNMDLVANNQRIICVLQCKGTAGSRSTMTLSVRAPFGAQGFPDSLFSSSMFVFIGSSCKDLVRTTIPSEVRAINFSPELACSKPNTWKPPFRFAADSKRCLATEWQHFTPVQIVLRALVRCAPILAREALT